MKIWSWLRGWSLWLYLRALFSWAWVIDTQPRRSYAPKKIALPVSLVSRSKSLAAVASTKREEDGGEDVSPVSKSGVSYARVQSGLNVLYPPSELESRMASSRQDGYWPFLKKAKDPPPEFTYGEFDFGFFAKLLDMAHDLVLHNDPDAIWSDQVFVDIGSGTGRLVFAASALHPWKLCRGIEILPTIHQAALDSAESLPFDHDDRSKRFLVTDENHHIPISPIEFVCGSFEDPYLFWGDADIIFCFSTCLPSVALENLAQSIARQCKPHTIVITTDYMLPLQGYGPPVQGNDQIHFGEYQFDLIQEVHGSSATTRGDSTAFIHEVRVSLWKEGQGLRERPKISLEAMCYEVVMALEADKSSATELFLRGVYNNMVFWGLPERWHTRIRDKVFDGK